MRKHPAEKTVFITCLVQPDKAVGGEVAEGKAEGVNQ